MPRVDHQATLRALNRNFVRSVDEADVAWFDANLASDFMNTNPDFLRIRNSLDRRDYS